MNTPPAGPSRLNSSQSVMERRRQLEAELAALTSDPSAEPYDVSSPAVLIPPADSRSRTSSSSSVRERPGSGNGKSTFEEVEVPSDVEPDASLLPSNRPTEDRRGSWFGWGSGKGYERVKTD